MGGGRSSLPHRINLIYGGRFALVKTGRGDCPVDVVEVMALFCTPHVRRGSSATWYLKAASGALDEHKRPLLCFIRNDRHPQRSLRAGEPIMADDCKWTADHRWLLEYEDPSKASDEAAGAPFHICSLSTRRYLAVDEATGKPMMQNFRPNMPWEMLDAGASCGAAPYSISDSSLLSEGMMEETASAGRTTVTGSYPPGSGSAETVAETCGLKELHGPMLQALSVHTHTQGGRAFTQLDKFLRDGRPLGEELTLTEPSTMLQGVLEILYGPGNYFRRDLAEADDAVLSPVKLVEGSPWCGWASVKQTCHVPVLGKRPYEEEFRIALCRTNEDGVQLAVQMACTLKIGLHMGDFNTEVLHIISQRTKDDPVRLRSFGIAQPGRAQQRALDGMCEGRAKYVRKARVAIREAPQYLLRLQSEEVKPEGSEWKEKGVSTVPSSERPVPGMESVEGAMSNNQNEESNMVGFESSWNIQRAMSSFVPSWSSASFMSDEHCLSGLGALRRACHVRAGRLHRPRRVSSPSL